MIELMEDGIFSALHRFLFFLHERKNEIIIYRLAPLCLKKHRTGER